MMKYLMIIYVICENTPSCKNSQIEVAMAANILENIQIFVKQRELMVISDRRDIDAHFRNICYKNKRCNCFRKNLLYNRF